MKPIRQTWNTLKNIALSGIKNFNVPLHETPGAKDQASSIPQLLHDCVGFLRRSGKFV